MPDFDRDAVIQVLGESFTIACLDCDGAGEVYGCGEDNPNACEPCQDGEFDHVVDCPSCGGSGEWSVVRVAGLPDALAEGEQ